MAMLVSFDHLATIRDPLGHVMDFDLSPLDRVVANAYDVCDERIEAHSLWEYEARCTSEAMRILEFDLSEERRERESVVRMDVRREMKPNAVVFWMEYDDGCEAGEGFSEGLQGVEKGRPVWHPYSKQAVAFYSAFGEEAERLREAKSVEIKVVLRMDVCEMELELQAMS